MSPDKATRTFRYRIYPTRRQAEALEAQLGFACDLYNAALEQRKDWWSRGTRVSEFDQVRQLTDLRRGGGLVGMNTGVQEDVMRRLNRAFQGFFRRVKQGEKPGFPRFRSRARYDSLTWRRYGSGVHLRDGRLALQGIGHVKVRWHRAIPSEATIRQATVRRTGTKWHVSFVTEMDLSVALSATGEEVGVDLGITAFAALSTGELIEGPRAFKAARRGLRRAQRRVSRRHRGSHRRRKAVEQLAARHEHASEVRRDHAHKLARDLVRRFDRIFIEDLNIAGMARGFLARDSLDQGWGQFVTILRAKAEEAGREVVAVDPRGTSQRCSECGEVVPKDLGVRTHRCDCGYVADRDVNAARNVLRVGRTLQASTGTASVA